jgi:hypothetical protein
MADDDVTGADGDSNVGQQHASHPIFFPFFSINIG